MKPIITSVLLTSLCALTSMAGCPDVTVVSETVVCRDTTKSCQPVQKVGCRDTYRDPYRIAYPRLMPVAEQVEITNTDRALAMRRGAVLRMREIVQFERDILNATPPLYQPAQSGVTVFGSTEGAGVYDSSTVTIPPPPPYTGPVEVLQTVQPTAPQAAPRTKRASAPIATPVPGRPGYVYSPFTSNPCVVDVQSLAPGSLAKDPYTGRGFRVP